MGILGSSIARLMLAVLTAAIGFMTLRTQSEFWFGVLVATAFAWGLLALDAIVADAWERDRAFWGTFLLVTLAILIWGFGPFSDRPTRGNIPTSVEESEIYAKNISYLSIFILRNRHLTAPHPYVEAITYDDGGKVHSRITVTIDPGSDISSEQFATSLTPFLKQDIAFFSPFRPNYPTRFAIIPFPLHVYMDAFHLLLALLMGFITAAMASSLYSCWRHRQNSAISPPQRNGIAEIREDPRMITIGEQTGP